MRSKCQHDFSPLAGPTDAKKSSVIKESIELSTKDSSCKFHVQSVDAAGCIVTTGNDNYEVVFHSDDAILRGEVTYLGRGTYKA